MNIYDLLPIGSVITVKEAEKSMMIIGIGQENEGKYYDYIGVLYPEGYLNSETIFLFNHNDISEVKFLGYMDVEYQAFRSILKDNMDSIANDAQE